MAQMLNAFRMTGSSTLDLLAYDPDKWELYIQFSSGTCYVYSGVMTGTVQAILLKSDADKSGTYSHGATFINRVKNQIPDSKVQTMNLNLVETAKSKGLRIIKKQIAEFAYCGWSDTGFSLYVAPEAFQNALSQWLQAA